MAQDGSGDDDSFTDNFSRRRMMQGLGVAGAAGLAGCGGREATAPDTSESSGGGGEDTDEPTATPVQVDSEALRIIQELAYVTNRTLPVLPLQEKLAQSFQTTDDWSVPSKDSDQMQVYWPTSWGPRDGWWSNASGASDERFTVAQWAVPSDSQYNPWNGKNYAEPRRVLFDRFMKYNLASAEYSGYAISDWSVDGQSVSLTVRDGLTWHDGDAVTATDVANQIKLDAYNGGSLDAHIDDLAADVTAEDESTVAITLNKAINEQILLAYLQPKQVVAKESVYGDYVSRLDEASGDEARNEVISELANMTVDDPVGCGPFQFEDADSQRTLLSKFDGHPDAGNVNFPEMEYRYLPSNQKRWNALINGGTDGSATLFMPANKVNQLPDSVQVSLIPRHWGLGLIFDHEDEHLGKRKVRQALAHVINREQVAKNSGAGTNSKIAVKYPTALTGAFSGQVEDAWLKNVADDFETYQGGASRAEALLQEAGYSKQDGTWADESGDPIDVPIKAPAGFSDWVAGAETVVDQLKQFGIEAQLLAKDTSTYWGKDYANGNFKVALQGWASYNQTYPYFHYDYLYAGGSGSIQDLSNFPDSFDVEVLHEQTRDSSSVDPVSLVEDLVQASN